jgi:hypothetical protein
MFSGCKESEQKMMAEQYAKSATLEDFKGVSKPNLPDSEAEQESLTPNGAPEGSPEILFILFKDPGQAEWSPSLWWSYQHNNTGQPGC